MNTAEYDCVFGPDVNGLFVEERVESNVATNCGLFCKCTGLTNNKCLIGPDATGTFMADYQATSETVDSCKAEFACICDKHPDIVSMMSEEGRTFEQIAQEWTESAVDLTTPGKELKPSRTSIIDALTGQINEKMPGIEP